MVVNPYARLAEADYTDNETTVTVAVAPVRTDQSINFPNPGSQSLATPSFALSATTSSGLNVSFTSLTSAVCTVSSDLVSLVAAGTCTIRATQSGNDLYHPAAAVEQSFAVQKIDQTITFDELPTRMLDDSPFALHAGASSGLEVTYTPLTTTICTVSGDTVTLIKVGTCTIRAEQAGDSRYHSAPEVEQSFTVVESDPAKSNQTITFAALPTRTIGDPPFTVNATVDSGLSLTYTSLTTAICTVSGNTVTLLRAGECTIQAAQAGNEAYNPAAPVSQTFTVTKRPQTITFGSLSDKLLGDEPFVVSTSASSGLAVSYSTETPVICTISGTIVTLVATGRCTIKASQPGSDIYDPRPTS